MKLIVGIGNPGEKYVKTRHNVGFQVADRLQTTVYSMDSWELIKRFKAEVCRPKADGIIIAKPQTFMNDSGKAVKSLATFYKIPASDIWVVHDDLDIRLGEYKIQFGTGPKVHHGIQSVDEALGTKDYWRVRVGIENRYQTVSSIKYQVSSKIPGEEYVLQNFTNGEWETLEQAIIQIVYEVKNRIV